MCAFHQLSHDQQAYLSNILFFIFQYTGDTIIICDLGHSTSLLIKQRLFSRSQKAMNSNNKHETCSVSSVQRTTWPAKHKTEMCIWLATIKTVKFNKPETRPRDLHSTQYEIARKYLPCNLATMVH